MEAAAQALEKAAAMATQAKEQGTGLTSEEAAQLAKLLKQARRRAEHERARVQAERDILKLEMEAELVDREANSARVLDRQRLLYGRTVALPGQPNVFEKAMLSAALVEAAINVITPHTSVVQKTDT